MNKQTIKSLRAMYFHLVFETIGGRIIISERNPTSHLYTILT